MTTPTPAIYSGVRVYEILCNGVPVMRRANDNFVNATQVLRAAGLPKTQRTKILERDVCPGIHEKIQGGYHMFQGTWVPLEAAVRLAKDHGLEQDMSILFDYEPDNSVDNGLFDAIIEAKKALKLVKPPPKPKLQVAAVPARWSSTSSSWSSSDDESSTRKVRRPVGRPRRPRQASGSPALPPSTPGTPPPLIGSLASGSGSGSNRISTRGKVYKPPGDLVEKRRPGRPKGSGRNASASQSPVPTAKKPRIPRVPRHSAPPGAVNSPLTIASVPNGASMAKSAAKTLAGLGSSMDSIDFDTMDLMDPYGLLDDRDDSDSDVAPNYFSRNPGSLKRHSSEGPDYPPRKRPNSYSRPYRHSSSSSSDKDDCYASFTDEDDLDFGSDPPCCHACGALTIPTWRKGPSGRRTLCDACGLKWCFGKLQPLDFLHRPGMAWEEGKDLSETSGAAGMDESEPESPSVFLMPNTEVSIVSVPSLLVSEPESMLGPIAAASTAVGATPSPAPNPANPVTTIAPTPVSHEQPQQQQQQQQPQQPQAQHPQEHSTIQQQHLTTPHTNPTLQTAQLLTKLQSMNRNRSRLRHLLDEVKREDRGADRAFRRAIVRCRRTKTSPFAPKVTFGGSHFFQDAEEDAWSEEDEMMEGGEDEKEMIAIARFIQAVRWRVGS
ncbi:hypothetical protein HDU97_009823 [Phlyctochytrium planicorne]|nr:hypothetical protein HDU97_009823 [Phlyctochytrium planicorne]